MKGLTLQERESKQPIIHPVRAGTLKHFTRGGKREKEDEDVLVGEEMAGGAIAQSTKRVKLKPFEVFLKRFEYKQALDAALVSQDRYLTNKRTKEETRV